MSARRLLAALPLALGLALWPAPARADTWVPWNLGELLPLADVVVVARVTGPAPAGARLEVREWLVGSGGGTLEVGSIVKNTLVFAPGDEGVFLFQRGPGAALMPYHPGCAVPLARAAEVRELLALATDPTPALATPTADRTAMLGHLFRDFRIRCVEYPALERTLSWHPAFWQEVPWSVRGRCVLELQPRAGAGAAFSVRVAECDPEMTALAEAGRRYLELQPAQPGLVPATLLIEARPPERVGPVTRDEVVRLLLRELEAAEPERVAAAIEAARRLRVAAATARIEELAEQHPEPVVRSAARELLRYLPRR